MIDNGSEAKCNNDSEICAALKEMKNSRGGSGECEYHNKTNILDEENMGDRTPAAVHHSLALDNGGNDDFGSLLVRLLSNESKSPTDFSEGRVRLSEFSGYLEVMEDGGK